MGRNNTNTTTTNSSKGSLMRLHLMMTRHIIPLSFIRWVNKGNEQTDNSPDSLNEFKGPEILGLNDTKDMKERVRGVWVPQ